MNDKLLAEYCGITWHMVKECRHPVLLTCMNRCICGRDIDTHLCVNPDFSTPEGYEMLHRAIGKNGDWNSLYNTWGMLFHELTCAEKAPLVSEWLEKR